MHDNKTIHITLHDIDTHVRVSNLIQLAPGYATFLRRIYHHQMIYVYDGRGIFEVEGRRYYAGKGDLFYWGPGQVHYIESHMEQPLVPLGVQFDFTQNHPDNLYTYPIPPEDYDPQKITEKVVFQDFQGFPHHMKLFNGLDAEKLLLEIAHESKTQKKYYQQRMDGLFKAFLFMIARNIESQKNNLQQYRNLIDQIIEYIHTHCHEEISNSKIASEFNFHPNYINKLMVVHTGMSLHQYLINARINKAMELLSETNMTVSEISQAVGFKNIHYFSRLFKKKIGQNPSELKK